MSEQIQKCEDLGLTLIRTSIDALTVSLTEVEAATTLPVMIEALRKNGGDLEPTEGRASHSFERSESYQLSSICETAHLFRRFKPQQASAALGSDYESWEVMGPGAALLASVLQTGARQVGRASRIDVAFDFDCQEHDWPPAIEEAITPHTDRAGLSIHHQGRRDTRTVYVGAPSSERRVRIYRHDYRHGGPLPTMRVELELRRKFADEVWKVWQPLGGPAIGLCCTHIHQLTGRLIDCDQLTTPAPTPARDVDLVASAAHALTQYGGVLEALLYCMVDLPKLVHLARDRTLRPGGDRVRTHRERRLMESAIEAHPNDLMDAILNHLDRQRRLRRRRRVAPAEQAT